MPGSASSYPTQPTITERTPMSKPKARSMPKPSKPTPPKHVPDPTKTRVTSATNATVDHPRRPPVAADKVTSTPKKPLAAPTYNDFAPRYLTPGPGLTLTEPERTSNPRKPVNVGTGNGKPTPPKNGTTNAR